VGAFLAFGVAPVSVAPVAQAVELDWVVDLLGAELGGALGDLSQVSSWETVFDGAAWEPLLANVGLSFDASVADVTGSAAADDWFGSLFYTPLHDFGAAVDFESFWC
jgi:endoglycosylceramidase